MRVSTRAVTASFLALFLAGAGTSCGKKRDIPPKEDRPTRLAARPSGAPSPGTSGTGSPKATASTTGQPGASPTPPTSPGSSPSASAAFREIGAIADGKGDHGTDGPPYADITNLRFEDNGDQARITLGFAGPQPDRLDSSTTMGAGVNIYFGEQRESDYQIFVDGSDQGWLAYFEAGNELVQFPGTFQLEQGNMVFVIPWKALGGKRGGKADSFCDWTMRSLPFNKAAEDHAPDSGRVGFAP